MKTKSLFTSLLLLLGFVLFANSNSNETKNRKLVDPTITVPSSVNGCAGSTASISISGPVNSFVYISYNNANYTVSLGATGNATFTTPILNQSATFVFTKIVQFNPLTTTFLSGISTYVRINTNASPTLNTNNGDGISPITSTHLCNSGECRTLSATPNTIASTTFYSISSISYCPVVSYSNPSWTQLYPTQVSNDDQWSPPFNLPVASGTTPAFNFCFFGNTYNQINVGTNGVIAFPNPAPLAGGSICPWAFSASVPNAALIKNAIFGVYQDTNYGIPVPMPDVLSANYSVIGVYPSRKFVVNFTNLPQFQCNLSVGLQTSQIVLYETTNIIEIYVQRRTACTTWNGGRGIIGIQNANGTQGYTPPDRNTGSWTATNEAWRFTPYGTAVPMTFQWLENGNPISTNLTTTVCPTATSTYQAQATYNVCETPIVVSSSPITLTVENDLTQNPNNLSVCFDSSQIYNTDLTQNNAVILGNLNPIEYQISYYQTLSDAQQDINAITNPSSYTFTGNYTIYVRIYNLLTGCHYFKTFDINILAPVLPPTGITPQNFTPGQTLADLVVAGTNIIWFDAPTGGNILPPTTLLQDNTTYYAAEVNANGCFSRNTNSTRLAITTLNSLSNSIFDTKNLLIYPNPTSGSFRITSDILIDSIEIFDVIGKKIDSIKFNEKNVSVNLSSYNSGVYFIKIYAESSSKIYKIVKE